MENQSKIHVLTDQSEFPSTSYDIFFEGNSSNISKTISIDISVKLGVVEYIQIGATCSLEETELYISLFKEVRDIFSWSYKEIPGIDPHIVIHEIETYIRGILRSFCCCWKVWNVFYSQTIHLHRLQYLSVARKTNFPN